MSKETTSKTFNISSNSTVFLKYFLPTIWIVFFGTLFTVILFAHNVKVGSMPPTTFKMVYAACFSTMIAIMYFTIFKLRRVELDQDYFYATNYIKIYRYSFESIQAIKKYNYGWWLIYTIELKKPGFFGKKITFLANKRRLVEYLSQHPEVATALNMEDVLEKA
jgi:hypothetical protein